MKKKFKYRYLYHKIDFKTQIVKKDTNRYHKMIKGTNQQEDERIVNIYTPNRVAPKYKNKISTKIKGEIDSNTIIVGNFNTPLTSVDISSRKKINKEIVGVNDTLVQMELTNTYRTLHQKNSRIFFSSGHRTFSRIVHMLGTKQVPISLGRLK